MAYRETPTRKAHKLAVRAKILRAASDLIAETGFSGASVTAIARRADVATGSVYRYFHNKQALCLEVFKQATEREVTQVRNALQPPGKIQERLLAAITTFVERAIRSRRLAYALIAEPLDTTLDQERLNYREEYAILFAQLIQEGVENGQLVPQNAYVAGAALVGTMAEALIGHLAGYSHYDKPANRHWQPLRDKKLLIEAIGSYCLRAVGPAQA